MCMAPIVIYNTFCTGFSSQGRAKLCVLREAITWKSTQLSSSLTLKTDKIQDDTSGCGKPPVDIKTKVWFWPGQARPGQAKTKLLFYSQREATT